MVSGKYSALSGAISREQTIANISNNLANINTAGYKRSNISFESILEEKQQITNAEGINYSRVAKNKVDLSQGPMRPTDNPLDLAIQGEGFFKLEGPNGTLYTRRGDFGIRSDGVLTTSHGLPVLNDAGGKITIPDTQASQIAFADDGTIFILGNQGRREEVGKVGLTNVNDTTLLKKEADTTFSLEQGGTEQAPENAQVLQGNLEMANVDMASAMAQLIDNQRAFETLHKAIKSYSTLSEQQEKLGSLG